MVFLATFILFSTYNRDDFFTAFLSFPKYFFKYLFTEEYKKRRKKDAEKVIQKKTFILYFVGKLL